MYLHREKSVGLFSIVLDYLLYWGKLLDCTVLSHVTQKRKVSVAYAGEHANHKLGTRAAEPKLTIRMVFKLFSRKVGKPAHRVIANT